MSDDDGFLGALLANPADETLRLVYADWLDDRDDPRGEFLRLWFEHQQRPIADQTHEANLAARLAELRGVINPAWAATISTLGVVPKPLSFGFKPEEMPLSEPLALRPIFGAGGQLTGLVTFASQFRLSAPPDAGLLADLRMLADMIPGLCDCYYGASDFQIYAFLAERTTTGEPTEGEVLAALHAQEHFNPGGYDGDSISQNPREQCFFRHESEEDHDPRNTEGIRDFLAAHIAPASLWFAFLRKRSGEWTRDQLHFAVGPSPNGQRLVGLLAGGRWG